MTGLGGGRLGCSGCPSVSLRWRTLIARKQALERPGGRESGRERGKAAGSEGKEGRSERQWKEEGESKATKSEGKEGRREKKWKEKRESEGKEGRRKGVRTGRKGRLGEVKGIREEGKE